MNTIRSVGYGWGVLVVAGAGSYYFAKRSVNADRAERAEAEERRRQQRERMRVHEAFLRDAAMSPADNASRKVTRSNLSSSSGTNELSPSVQAQGDDPALSASGVGVGRSRYEASEPFRSRKGDRFS